MNSVCSLSEPAEFLGVDKKTHIYKLMNCKAENYRGRRQWGFISLHLHVSLSDFELFAIAQ